MLLRDVDAATWGLLNRLLDQALDVPAEERERWLASLPSEAEPLVPRLRALLTGSGSKGPLWTLPKVGPNTEEVQGVAPAVIAGDTVGPYRLVRMLGEGGMGAVWLAERTDGMVQRPVALKLPRGAGAGAGLAERMAREREILAGLAHPNVARLYDAGVTSVGQPWLALEYVEGRTIDRYAREERLDVRARLGLFLQVARAVAHAHARLVVHRDLKPSNILVTAEGEVRLLDFGIAKLIEEEASPPSALTEANGRAFTLAYASPEQVAGERLGVGTDIYSLGMVLYELLCEVHPYQRERSSRAALEAAVRSTEPARPSAVAKDPATRKVLRGDLDTILLHALKKSLLERYPTANAFAEDVERWLRHLPVRAQPDRVLYRARKFVARHRLAVGSATAALLLVLAGAGAALWQARLALAEKRRAEEVKGFIASLLRDADPGYGAAGASSLVGLLEGAHQRIMLELPSRPDIQVELLEVVGSSLGSAQDLEGAARALDDAIATGSRALGPGHPLTLRARVARVELYRFERKKLEEVQGEIADLRTRLRAPGADPTDLVNLLRHSAQLAMEHAHVEEAFAAAQESFDVAIARLGERSVDTANSALELSSVHLRMGNPAKAKQVAAHALQMMLALHPGDPRHPGVSNARYALGRAMAEEGELPPAIEMLTEVADAFEERLGPDSIDVGIQRASMTRYLLEAGDLEAAQVSAAKALRLISARSGHGSEQRPWALATQASVHVAARRASLALPDLESAVADLTLRFGPSHPKVRGAIENRALARAYLGRVAEARQELGALLHGEPARERQPWKTLRALSVVERLDGAYAEAERLAREALALLEGPRSDLHRALVLPDLGLALVAQAKHADAVPVLEEALTLIHRLQTAPSPQRADALLGLGRARLALGQAPQALAPLEASEAFWRTLDPSSRWTGEGALWLSRCQAALGDRVRARETRARALQVLYSSPLPNDVRLGELARRE